MPIRSREKRPGELARAQESEEQAMQFFLEKWDLLIWDSLPVWSYKKGMVNGGCTVGHERKGGTIRLLKADESSLMIYNISLPSINTAIILEILVGRSEEQTKGQNVIETV